MRLSYLSRAQFDAHCSQFKNRILGATAFGAERPAVIAAGFPYSWVDMPVLEGTTFFETWTSEQTVACEATPQMSSAYDAEFLFGCLQNDATTEPAAATLAAYNQLFDYIDRRGYPHLLRTWNYLPHINAVNGDLDRYHQFCVGRHAAFTANARVIGEATPAACALGTRDGPFIVYFIAAKQAGRQIENPRQTNAYCYPAQYGPRSPTFSRAMRTHGDYEPVLFISGTASIVGHSTLHAGNAAAQAQETATNLRAVMDASTTAPVIPRTAELWLKAYLRDPQHLPVMRDCMERTFGSAAHIVYLQADICRTDLLLEVEATQSGGAT